MHTHSIRLATLALGITIVLLAGVASSSNAVAQLVTWAPPNGPFGGDIMTIAFTKTGTLLAGSWTGGLYRSSDHGATWTEPAPVLHGEMFQQIAVAPDGRVYATCHDAPNYDTIRRTGVYFSADDGLTWDTTRSPEPNFFAISAAVAPNGDLYVGGAPKLWRSRDGGTTWTLVGGAGSGGLLWEIAAAPSSTVYYIRHELGSGDKLARLKPDGTGSVLTLPTSAGSNLYTIRVSAAGVVYLGSNNGLFRSTDEGETWTWVKFDAQGSKSTTASIAIDSAGTLMTGNGAWVRRSTDNGTTWTSSRTGLITSGIRDFVTAPDGVTWMGANAGGVFTTTDHGVTWQPHSNGLYNADVNAVAVAPNGSIFAATQGAGLWRTTNEGATWTQLAFDEGLVEKVVAHSNGVIDVGVRYVVGTEGYGVHRSLDDGATWQALPQLSGGTMNLAVGANGDVYATTARDVFRLRSGDTAWKRLRACGTIDGMVVDDGGVIYVAVSDSGIFSSPDGGGTWRKGTFVDGSTLTLEALVAGHGEAYAIGSGVQRTTDGGVTWRRVGPLPEHDVFFSLTLDPAGVLFMTTNYDGVLRSRDHGATWGQINDGIHTPNISTAALDSAGHLLAGTRNAGVLRTNGPAAAVPRVPAPAHAITPPPLVCVPNPCTTTAVIRFHAGDGAVEIELADNNGRSVRRAALAACGTEGCEATVDVAALPAGRYACRVRQHGAVVAGGSVVIVR